MPVLTLKPHVDPSLPSLPRKPLVFEAPESRAVLSWIERIAPSEATVLITGETGSGKEIIARYIYQQSRRSAAPFVAVNCGALSANLVESELFGHEKGAFTGALQSKAGWFEVANEGTLFLDEIGDLPLPAQVKLLRVLQENEVVRVGARQPIPTNVRLIAATNVDLEKAMEAGHFREDLYYRLNVAVVKVPPLRERLGDIEPLVRHFIDIYQRRLNVGPVVLGDLARRKLLEYSWPGNVRELENTIHHALLVCRNGVLQPEDVPLNSGVAPRPRTASSPPPSLEATSSDALDAALRELFETSSGNLYERVEHALLRTAYQHCERNQLQTARLLGISRNVVRARLIQYGELTGSLRSTPPPSVPPESSPRDHH
jgi:sigma-54 dependent transcriptional regulator